MKSDINDMPYVKLRSGNKMPAIGLGTWQLTGDKAHYAVREALDLGYRMIDTASDYENAEQIKAVLQECDIPRSELFISTKVEENDNAYIAAKAYVSSLGLDYADLILIHRPPESSAGEELWDGLRQARDEGVTREIGVSNYSTDQLQALYDSSKEWPAVNQIEWTPFGHSREMHVFCRKHKIQLEAYSPLAHSGKLNNDLIMELADKYGKSPSQVVLRWDLQHGVVPMPKASSREHLLENFDIFDFELSPTDMKALDGLNQYYSALGSGSLAYI